MRRPPPAGSRRRRWRRCDGRRCPARAALEKGLGDRHAGGVGDALAERAGRGLDAAARVVFGMALAVRAEFAEALDLVEGDLRVAAEVEQRVEQHRAVAVRLHEAVAVEPERILGVELQVPGEQRRGDVGGAERRAGMPLARLARSRPWTGSGSHWPSGGDRHSARFRFPPVGAPAGRLERCLPRGIRRDKPRILRRSMSPAHASAMPLHLPLTALRAFEAATRTGSFRPPRTISA